MERIYDPIRCKFVAATPEEKLRQNLIRQMIGSLGYPKGLIAVEKDLKSIRHIPPDMDPDRRIDILCFIPGKGGLKPLLLVECKAKNKEAEQQIFGYNQWVGAPFIALATPSGVKTMWIQKEGTAFVPFLPAFAELQEKLCKKSFVF